MKNDKKILLLNGSPRMNGNTRGVLKELEKALLAKGGVQVDFVDICRCRISGCVNCDSCRNNGGTCVQKDDTNLLMEKVVSSDGIVFGSPVYWMGVSGQLKLFIDKFYCKDAVMHGLKKSLGIISVGAAELSDRQYGTIEAQFREMAEYLEWHFAFGRSFSAWNEGDWAKDPANAEAVRELANLL